jgi:hypothetical protein
MAKRKPKIIKRVPIIRKAIILPQEVKAYLKLLQLQEETREDDILEIVRHYEMLARKVIGKAGYCVVSPKEPTKSKRWIHFERVYEVCRMQHWDGKLYIESQFKRLGGVPMAHMMYSVAAMRYFTNYLANIKRMSEKDVGGKKKEKGRRTLSGREEVIEGVITSAEVLNTYISKSIMDDKAQYKAIKIYQAWRELSPYYLWSVPWFHDVVSTMTGESNREKLVMKEFNMIHETKSLQELIRKTVTEVESHFNIPPNIALG